MTYWGKSANRLLPGVLQEYGVNSAKITDANNKAGNGIIHVIDRVLFPPEQTAMQKIKADPRLS